MWLVVETSSSQGGLALIGHEGLLQKKTWVRHHSELITCEFQDLLHTQELAVHDLQGLIVSTGPGSFTGIRVGLNFVKSLSYSLNLPIFAYDSLLALAHSGESEGPLLCMINAHKNMVYIASYEKQSSRLRETMPPQALPINELDEHISQNYFVFGDALSVYGESLPEKTRQHLTWKSSHPKNVHVEGLSSLFLSEKDNSSTIRWQDLRPLYVRPSSAEENHKRGLLKPLPKID